MDSIDQIEEIELLRKRVTELEAQLGSCKHDMAQHSQVLQHFRELSLARAILESGGDGVIVADETGRVVYANPAARQMVGDSLFDLNAFEWADRRALFSTDTVTPYQPEDFPLLRALRGEVIEAEEAYVWFHSEQRGLWLSITAMPITSEDASLRGAFVDFRNITERKRAEQELLLRDHAMASSEEGICISDPSRPDNPLVYINAGFERLTGYTDEEALGRNCRFLQGPETDQEALQQIREAVAEGRPCWVELVNYRKDGSKFWNRLSITPVRDGNGKIMRFIGIQSDITAQKDTEARLEEVSRGLQEANKRMRYNLQAAAKVQKALLPAVLPELEQVRFAWHFEPSEELSGDLLNVFQLDEDHVGLYLLDVSGHGVASSLLSVSVNRVLTPMRGSPSVVLKRIFGTKQYRPSDPVEVGRKLNEAFPWDSETGQFFTLMYGVLDCPRRTLRYICAGHPTGVLTDASGNVSKLEGSGLPIGLQRKEYVPYERTFAPGDRVYFYSDGLSEALSVQDDVFGEERLLRAVREIHTLPLTSSVESLVTYVRDWARPRRFGDDVSVVALEIF
jgi:PAS domain S-box-containing protein